jgi:subfamily B ATP-binding cassette protein MsbA
LKPWIDLLRPHKKVLILALLAAIGEAVSDIAQPWPLKIVLDNVLHHHSLQGRGWLNHLVMSTAGTDRWAVLRLATLAALIIAVVGAVCSYAQNSLTCA